MVCQFLLYNKVNQLYVCIYPHIPSLLGLPPTLPIPPLQVVTKHRADLPVRCSCFPVAIYFTSGSVYMSMLLSHFVPVYPSPSLCPQVLSLHLHLYSCCFFSVQSSMNEVSRFRLRVCQQTRYWNLLDPFCSKPIDWIDKGAPSRHFLAYFCWTQRHTPIYLPSIPTCKFSKQEGQMQLVAFL